MIYLRKIDKGKWADSAKGLGAPIYSDPITSCLRTRKNTLSLWQAESNENIKPSLFALLGALQTLDTIDYLIITDAEISNLKLKLNKSDGLTAADKYKYLHQDIINITLSELSDIAYLVREKIFNREDVRLTRSQVIELIKEGIHEGHILVDLFPENVKCKLVP